MHLVNFDQIRILARTLQLATSISLALLVTAMLILLMISLISMQPQELEESGPKISTVVMPEERKIIEQNESQPIKPVEPEPIPETPPIESVLPPDSTSYVMTAPTMDAGPVDPMSGPAAGSAVPTVQIAPRYPRNLQERGIEGFVDLMFDITPSGRTDNIRVLNAEPEGLFESASIRALRKWKYKPAFDGDTAIIQRDQVTRISFTLQD